MKESLKIAFFGSSLVSSYWNGAATYYRGIIKELHRLGHKVTFYEPDAFQRQEHRDLHEFDWATSVVYEPNEAAVEEILKELYDFDVLVKASGVGVLDNHLEAVLPTVKKEDQLKIYWDVDAPATLERMHKDPLDDLRTNILQYDLVLTYGGGQPVVDAYEALGARKCIPIYNALDPETHHPETPEEKYQCDLAFLGNRLPDREERVEEFFIKAAQQLPDKTFFLGGNGWHDKALPANITVAGHVYTHEHNPLNSTALAVLNISRESMASYGFSPATRVFEAAGAGACIITDFWEGIDFFFEPGAEILVARNGDEVADLLRNLTPERARAIGEAAKERVLKDHTYALRAKESEEIFFKHLSKEPAL